MARVKTHQKLDSLQALAMHAKGMTTKRDQGRLAVVGRSVSGQQRTVDQDAEGLPGLSSAAAYRRLATVLLGLDVSTLASQLRSERLAARTSPSLAA